MSKHPPVRFLDRTTPPHVLTLVLLAGIPALSMNIFLPSLPRMTEYFATDYRLMQLSVSLYLGVNAVLQILIGPISDRFGRRPVLLAAAAIFVLATIGTLLATTIEMFLVFRMGQAAIVAGMVLSRAVIRDMVPAEQAASLIGYVTMGMSIIPMLGPVIGGTLDQAFGWQANFVLLLCAGIFLFALIWKDLGETATLRDASLMTQIREYPELLASRRFWGYCLVSTFTTATFFAYLGGAPFVGTQVFHMEPQRLGLYFGAPAVGYALGNYLAGRYSMRLGINRMILLGTLATTLGLMVLLVLVLAGISTPEVFFGLVSTIGFGNGVALPNATAGMLSVRPHLAGTASGLGGAITIGGGALFSAFAGTVLMVGGGALPLVLLMLLASGIAILAVLYVIRREKEIGGL